MPKAGSSERPTETSGSAATMLPRVYDALRRLARRALSREKGPLTLQPTALVHEAYLRLLGGGDVTWENRAHFFGAAAEAMRRILVERARRARRIRHGGDLERVSYDEGTLPADVRGARLLRLDEALRGLETEHPRQATVVVLRYFCGLTIDEVAGALGLSPATVKVDWSLARARLGREMARMGRESATERAGGM